MAVPVQIGRHVVGGDQPTLIVLEAGPTHGGFEGAKRILQSAAAAGVHAVKFQLFDPDDVMADRGATFVYEVLVDEISGETERIEEPLYDILTRRVLPAESWGDIAGLAADLDLDLYFTVASEADVAFACELGAASLKIASGDLTYAPLIKLAAESSLPLQLDSGGGTLEEVARAIGWISSVPNSATPILHHCPTGYPARWHDVRLRAISDLKAAFDLPVGFSDHSPGWEMDIAAVALGANLVEKNVTHSRLTRDVEHLQAIEVRDLQAFASAVRNVEAALENGLKHEHQPNPLVRRGAYLSQDAGEGTQVADLAIRFQRPCRGLEPWEVPTCLDKRLRRPLSAGDPLTWDCLA